MWAPVNQPTLSGSTGALTSPLLPMPRSSKLLETWIDGMVTWTGSDSASVVGSGTRLAPVPGRFPDADGRAAAPEGVLLGVVVGVRGELEVGDSGTAGMSAAAGGAGC